MSTVRFNNNQSGNSNQKSWTRASIAAAVAAGAITTEAANILYRQLLSGSETEQITNPTSEPTPELEPTLASTAEGEQADYNDPTTESTSQPERMQSSNLTPHQEPTPQAEPVPIPEPTPEIEPTLQPEPTPIPEPTPEPIPEPELNSEPLHEPEFSVEPAPSSGEIDDVVDVIVTEIDPLDIEMEDLFFVEDIGTIYTEDGYELNVAVVNDGLGTTNLFVDVDGDQVYDLVTTEEGDVIAQLPIDMDVSDMELIYAQQHGYGGYIEPNAFDIAMNDENSEIQSDISLS